MSNDKTYTRRRVLPMPRAADKAQQLKYALKRLHQHRKKWVEPDDASLILNLHFSVKSFRRGVFHAEASLEIPVDEGFQYYSISKTTKTKAGALRGVIEEIQNSKWFHHMKAKKVYFKVTGIEMEELYRGYL